MHRTLSYTRDFNNKQKNYSCSEIHNITDVNTDAFLNSMIMTKSTVQDYSEDDYTRE